MKTVVSGGNVGEFTASQSGRCDYATRLNVCVKHSFGKKKDFTVCLFISVLHNVIWEQHRSYPSSGGCRYTVHNIMIIIFHHLETLPFSQNKSLSYSQHLIYYIGVDRQMETAASLVSAWIQTEGRAAQFFFSQLRNMLTTWSPAKSRLVPVKEPSPPGRKRTTSIIVGMLWMRICEEPVLLGSSGTQTLLWTSSTTPFCSRSPLILTKGGPTRAEEIVQPEGHKLYTFCGRTHVNLKLWQQLINLEWTPALGRSVDTSLNYFSFT